MLLLPVSCPAEPTPAPSCPDKVCERTFDTASFFGGLILGLGLLASGYYIVNHCGARRGGYTDLDRPAPVSSHSISAHDEEKPLP